MNVHMKNIQTKYKLNFKTMKKGLLTLLAASLVFVGCQNYDDQFDDLNAQISALKSQVDGLSALSGQVASLSGTISGLQAGISQAASSSSLSALSASLTALQADVDAVQASLATAATASAVTALQAEVAAIQADVDDLLATSNVYTNNLSVTTPSELDAAVALGNNINIVNGTVNISQTATMDATKLQGVIDKIFTTTGSYTYTTSAASNTAMTFDKLTSTGDLTLTVNGPISAKALVTAGTITLNTTYTSSVTSVNMDSLTTVTDITTGSSNDTVNFSSAEESATLTAPVITTFSTPSPIVMLPSYPVVVNVPMLVAVIVPSYESSHPEIVTAAGPFTVSDISTAVPAVFKSSRLPISSVAPFLVVILNASV